MLDQHPVPKTRETWEKEDHVRGEREKQRRGEVINRLSSTTHESLSQDMIAFRQKYMAFKAFSYAVQCAFGLVKLTKEIIIKRAITVDFASNHTCTHRTRYY